VADLTRTRSFSLNTFLNERSPDRHAFGVKGRERPEPQGPGRKGEIMTATQVTKARIAHPPAISRRARRKGLVAIAAAVIVGAGIWLGILVGTGAGTVTVQESEFNKALKRYHEMELAPVAAPQEPGYTEAFRRMKEEGNAITPSSDGTNEALRRLHQDAAVPSN
jgi:hypothetical protein